MFNALTRLIFAVAALCAVSGSAHATFHLWHITQVYSNADTTVQFIELTAYGSGEQFISGHTITSSQGATTHSYTFPTDLPGETATTSGGYYGTSTSYKSFLIGTQGFAALGLVTPDYIVPNGFLFTANGRVNYAEGADTLSYASLPTDGSRALNRGGTTSVNSPMNFAGQSGTVTVAALTTSYEGLWLRTPFESESGWGLNLTHQGAILFATWFTYDNDGSGMWLVMSNGAQTSPGNYTGSLYRTTGPAFNSVPFASIGPSNYTPMGSLSLSFTDASTGTMTYTVNGITQSKPIARLIYALPAPTCTLGGAPGPSPNYQDLWWSSPANSESGWGVNITHQGDILFATWFTYEAGGTAMTPGKGMWLVMAGGVKTAPGVYSGDLQRTTGPALTAVPWNPALVGRTTVGNGTFTFTDANNGIFRYTVNGITQSKPITRLIYGTPATVCQ
jgi:hypothetical protein